MIGPTTVERRHVGRAVPVVASVFREACRTTLMPHAVGATLPHHMNPGGQVREKNPEERQDPGAARWYRFIAAACGSDDDGGGASDTTAAAGTEAPATEAPAGSEAPSSEPADTGAVLAGGMTVTYNLNPDAVWDDGTPITSADLECTYRRRSTRRGRSEPRLRRDRLGRRAGPGDTRRHVRPAVRRAYKGLFSDNGIIKADAVANCDDIPATSRT